MLTSYTSIKQWWTLKVFILAKHFDWDLPLASFEISRIPLNVAAHLQTLGRSTHTDVHRWHS